MADTQRNPDRASMLIWPDGQIRAEEPYRCGAFVTSLPHLQCTKLSDHDGPHEFPNEYPNG